MELNDYNITPIYLEGKSRLNAIKEVSKYFNISILQAKQKLFEFDNYHNVQLSEGGYLFWTSIGFDIRKPQFGDYWDNKQEVNVVLKPGDVLIIDIDDEGSIYSAEEYKVESEKAKAFYESQTPEVKKLLEIWRHENAKYSVATG